MPEKKIGYTNVFSRNQASKAQVVVNVGGAGSSKSHSLAQLFISRLVSQQNKTIGVCRKTFPALRMTAMALILGLLKDYGIYNESRHNKTANVYSYGTNQMWFFSQDESEKIKSANFNYLWLEEGNEFTYEDFVINKLRLRAPTPDNEPNQLFLSLNPSDSTGWIPTRLIHEEGVEVIHSTFQDNLTYLSPAYIKTLTDLIHQDENFYRIYALGEWGAVQRRIYTNYQIIPALPTMPDAKWCYGLDYGLVHPSALIKIYLFEGKLYAEERLYKPGKTTSDIIEFLSHEEKGDIYADPSSKMQTEEIRRAGYNAFDGHKGVKESIDLCKRHTILIPQTSVNLIKEIQSYQWRSDRQGNVLEEPVKFNDDALDAFRYGAWGLITRFGDYMVSHPQTTKPIESLTFGDKQSPILERWLNYHKNPKSKKE